MSEANPFVHDHLTDREILRELHRDMREVRGVVLPKIEAKQELTNGRVTRLERAMWVGIGAISVITAIVVPLFLDMVIKGG